jgi:hypothetical protein
MKWNKSEGYPLELTRCDTLVPVSADRRNAELEDLNLTERAVGDGGCRAWIQGSWVILLATAGFTLRGG